jgi:hypothetical protein
MRAARITCAAFTKHSPTTDSKDTEGFPSPCGVEVEGELISFPNLPYCVECYGPKRSSSLTTDITCHGGSERELDWHSWGWFRLPHFFP